MCRHTHCSSHVVCNERQTYTPCSLRFETRADRCTEQPGGHPDITCRNDVLTVVSGEDQPIEAISARDDEDGDALPPPQCDIASTRQLEEERGVGTFSIRCFVTDLDGNTTACPTVVTITGAPRMLV